MSDKNHEGNKSPDIDDGNDQSRCLCSRAIKHEAMKAYDAQGSSFKGSKEGRTPKCPRADKAVTGSNFRRGGEDMNVHWQIGMLLGAAFKKGELPLLATFKGRTRMSIGR
jgi:hypothetical protein